MQCVPVVSAVSREAEAGVCWRGGVIYSLTLGYRPDRLLRYRNTETSLRTTGEPFLISFGGGVAARIALFFVFWSNGGSGTEPLDNDRGRL